MRTALLLFATLAACSPKSNDGKICNTPPSIAMIPGDVPMCVHKWAYRLALAPGTSAQIAEAVIGACNGTINFKADADKNDAVSSSYGEQVEMITKDARREAIFRVTQARAGRCSIP